MEKPTISWKTENSKPEQNQEQRVVLDGWLELPKYNS